MNLMHTTASETRTTPPRSRRSYSPELKLQVVGACAKPGASIAAVAMQHGINANIVHRWLREHSQGTLANVLQTFVPVALNAATEPAPVQSVGKAKPLCRGTQARASVKSSHCAGKAIVPGKGKERKVILSLGLTHPVGAVHHLVRAAGSPWIEMRFNSEREVRRAAELVALAVAQL